MPNRCQPICAQDSCAPGTSCTRLAYRESSISGGCRSEQGNRAWGLAPDEETQRFVAAIYADRRQAAENSPPE